MFSVFRASGPCSVLLALALVAPGSASAQPIFNEYVALGDSWAADFTLNPTLVTDEFVSAGCGQSRRSYAKQVASALAVPVFRDAACSGAKTEAMTEVQAEVPPAGNPPQFDRLTPATDLVTLLIGGNDIGLAEAVSGCLTSDPAVSPCTAAIAATGTDKIADAIGRAEPAVIAVIAGIRERSPRARILLLNYFQSVGAGGGCYPEIPIADADARWLGEKVIALNAMLARVATTTEVQLVDTYEASTGHDVCQPPGVRWTEGLIPFSSTPNGPAAPFHPNQLGADYQARTVLAALGR